MAIQRASLVEITMDRIKSHILENNLKENDKFLSEKELVNQLQVSRTVIREALRSLESIGILKVKPGDGTFVGSGNFDSIKTILKHHFEAYGVKIRELLEIRKVIELGALRLIIEKELKVDVHYLTEINHAYYQAIQEHTDTKAHDQLFHQQLIKETQNQTFYHFADVIQDYFSLVKMDVTQNKENLLMSYQEHQKIIQALQQKNLQTAQMVMTQHFKPVFQYIHEMEGNKS
ncbi:FadR/GntR family transcriptional regulator [Gracilibacillus alcaliphilus]|uniref:FadR/GntR family transcriptional regulator n=1 Tax=Gracilibacillus alcaliphilus TaxID=1401441 RepID=UPI0019579439|nr:FCD domain-containing protein [Gracilibacillus alcaliphilus]MBM7677125.1 GntR family transcriptional repressor for pyruvate dehydrogenase complex [Gracilibacillus alcaliphilus]